MRPESFAIVPLTPELTTVLLGREAPRTVRGFAFIEGGKPQVLFGLQLEIVGAFLISKVMPEFRCREQTVSRRRLVVMMLRKAKELMATTTMPVYTIAEEGVSNAAQMITHMGFKPLAQGVYVWPK